MRRAIDPSGFEAKFRGDIDPWNYRASPFEAYKRRVLLRACGDRLYGRGLELACAIGETSRLLSERCLRLLANDSAPTAIREAKRQPLGRRPIDYAVAELPDEMPRGPFDLIVASEIAYYLKPRDLARLLQRVTAALAPGGRLVALHHLKPFDDAAQLPALAQRRIRQACGVRMHLVFLERHARFEAVAYEKPRRA
ncbi:class I SAM-dependent DNA methyltransferase [Mangrovicella endophytica]|uniref:class I SAM-dependent DNA methyltransferase n=1 Tax=Mangrovicella endophytica TaxID=2066697 RepID=UPI000C9DCEF7|nr:methyltransferase [Mangrovicella endophytica]